MDLSLLDPNIVLAITTSLGVVGDAIGVTSAFQKWIQHDQQSSLAATLVDSATSACNRYAARRTGGLKHFTVALDGPQFESELKRWGTANQHEPLWSDFMTPSKHLVDLIAPCIAIEPQVDSAQRIDISQHLAVLTVQDVLHRLPRSPIPMNQLLIESVAKQNLDFASIGSQLSQLNDTLIDVRSRLEATEPHIKPSVLLAEAGASPHARAFNKLKAEDFDHDYTHLASLFHSPWDYELLTGEDNMIIEGGRGCGKSMILKSMELRAAVELVRLQRFQQRQSITFAESGLRYFGIYVKLPSGMFHEWDADCALTMNKAVTLFQHVFNMMMLRGVLENLRSAQRAGIVHLSESGETAFCKDICLRIGISESYDRIEVVLRAVQLELNAVQDYMVQLRLENPAAVFKGHATSIHSFLNECCESIRSNTDDLKNVRFYLLLDEYENFSEQQQRVVNTLGKNRPPSLTLKIATRRLGIKARTDLGGEPMQKPRDYLVTYLDYDPNDARYAEMLAAIVRKRLSAAGYAFSEIRDLLATPPKYHPAEPDDVFRIIEKSAEAIGGSALSHLKSGDTRELYHRFERAAVFRACEANFSPYTYAGFDDFVLLSSGIVSNFLMLCRMSFYMAEMDNISVRAGTPIPWSCQSRAVYDVSQTAMENISTNIQDYGGAISRLVRDLADFIRVKLLKHQTEPESSRVQITDPGRLDDQECQQAQTILNEAVRWSVLHEVSEESSYRPKQKEKPRPKDFLINRILCPMLKISPRPRWAIKIAVSDILRLLNEDTRLRRRRELLIKHSGEDRKRKKPSAVNGGLFSELDAEGNNDD